MMKGRHQTIMKCSFPLQNTHNACALLFVAFLSTLASAQVPSSVRDAIATLQSTIKQDVRLEQSWDEYLELTALSNLVGDNEYQFTGEDLAGPIEQLAKVERELDAVRASDTSSKLNNWLKSRPGPVDESTPPQSPIDSADGDDADRATIAAVEDLQEWLSRSGLRTWQQLLKVDDVLEQIKSDADESDEAPDDDTVRAAVALLDAEAAGQVRNERLRLRRALSVWQDELEVQVNDQLAASARQLKLQFRDVDSGFIQAKRQQLQNALQELNNFLRTGPDDRRFGWQDYLHLPELQAELMWGDRPIRRPLIRSYQRLSSGYPGLEQKRFEALRQALQDYLQVSQVASPLRSQEAQRRQLQDAMNGLDRALVQAGATKEQEWKAYLDWLSLAELSTDSSPDVRQLGRLMSRFESDEEGLELAPFSRVRRELTRYVELIQQDRGPAPIDRYREQMEQLARSLDEFATLPSATVSTELTDRLEWLSSTGYATDLTYRIRNAFRRPNLRVDVDGDFFVQRMADTRNEATPVNRCFEGAHVLGCARTSASFTGQLVPMQNAVAIDILVGGTTVADTTARQRKVSVFSQGITWTTGTKRIFFDPNGISSTCATATACTHQSTCGVHVDRRVGRRLISRFARRKAKKTTPKAISLANSEAQQTIASRLDEETGEMLAKANRQFHEQMDELRRGGLYPDQLNMSSTSEQINIRGLVASNSYLGSPTEPPALPMSGQVKAQLHESLINNMMAKQLGGRQIDNEMIVETMRDNGMEVPDELLAPSERKSQPQSDESDELDDATGSDDDQPEEWSMTFDRRFPVIVRITDDGLSIAIRGREFSNAEQDINELIEISALYQLKKKPDGTLDATRQGKVNIQFVNSPGRLSNKQLTYKTFLQRKMDPLFRENVSTEDLPKMGRLSDVIDSIKIDRLETTLGWLTAMLKVDPSVLDELMPLE